MSQVPETLRQQLPHLPPGAHYCVAFSGGLDSSVLLHAMSRLFPDQLRVLHVHHGMQSKADHWADFCAAQCADYGLHCELLHVAEALRLDWPALGPEAAARRARYVALTNSLRPGDILLTAHHRRDQAETVLLQALRGAGPAGLAAMPLSRPFGRSVHCRPLLDLPREALLAYAQENGLKWLDDPSNQDSRLARGRLRQLWGELVDGWPGAEHSLARSARHMASAAELMDDLAQLDLADVREKHDAPLRGNRLLELAPARQANVLRYWIRDCGLPTPDTDQLDEILAQLRPAGEGAHIHLSWSSAELRSHAGCLYVMPSLSPVSSIELDWPLAPDASSALPELLAYSVEGEGLAQERGPYTLRLRRGGERIQLARRAHRTTLKQVLQAAGLPPWLRERVPLLFSGEVLVAVADYWIDPRWAPAAGSLGWQPEWRPDIPGALPAQIVRQRAFG